MVGVISGEKARSVGREGQKMALKKRPGVEKEHRGKRENNWVLYEGQLKRASDKKGRAKVSNKMVSREFLGAKWFNKSRALLYSGD